MVDITHGGKRLRSSLRAKESRVILSCLGLCSLMMGAGDGLAAARPMVGVRPAGEVQRFDPVVDRLIAPGAVVELLADGFGPTEGPIWKDRRLWISDMQNDETISIGEAGDASVIARGTGGGVSPVAGLLLGPNGMLPYRDGVLICRQGTRDIAFFRKGKLRSVVSRYQGHRLNSPNDMVFGPDGALWFTDPAFSVPGGSAGPKPDLSFEGVYRLHRGRLQAVVTDLVRPNGIAFSPDGRTLYVSSGYPGHNRIRAYTVDAAGRLSDGRDFKRFPDNPAGDTSVPMDGMKIDKLGNLWASGPGGLNVIAPDGRVLAKIRVAGGTTANLVFGGEDGRTLFIVGGQDVYRLKVLVRGQTPRKGEISSLGMP